MRGFGFATTDAEAGDAVRKGHDCEVRGKYLAEVEGTKPGMAGDLEEL